METIKINSYEIKKSRSDHDIPVVNGIHLHSSYNPIREAASLISKHSDFLNRRKDVLILGLGFAYHVEEVIRVLQAAHGTDYNIVIIEPNKVVYDDARFSNCLRNDNIRIYYGDSVDSYFSSKDLVNFLASKPVVIAHPASFNLYTTFFKKFLSFKASKKISDLCAHIDSALLRDYLSRHLASNSVNCLIREELDTSSSFSEDYDFLMMAFRNMTPTLTDSEAK